MTKIFYSFLFLFFFFSANAQTDVYLNIHHMLGSKSFKYNHPVNTNMDINFELTRLEYYLAEIKLTYDGGKDTLLGETWILVDASKPTKKFLGSFKITNLESVSFAVGVQDSFNHTDPTTYPANHPLAPKFPSMHWGWTAGYRFVALEGNTGNNMNENMEIHALGDKNYFTQTIVTSGYRDGNDLVVNLKGDYAKGLNSIDITGGLIYHGEDGETIKLLQNFQQKVFSEAHAGVGVSAQINSKFNFHPNPVSKEGVINLGTSPLNRILQLTDLAGRTVANYPVAADGRVQLNLPATGYFFAFIYEKNEMVETGKIMVTE